MQENPKTPEIDDDDLVTPEQAEAILRPEVQQLQSEGWRLVAKPLYGARLEKGVDVLDLRVDLLGNIERETKLTAFTTATRGRMVAWVLLITTLLVVLVFASEVGLLD